MEANNSLIFPVQLVHKAFYNSNLTLMDIRAMLPFEREIHLHLLNNKIKELNKK
jgi:hypothetical protein